MGIGSWLGTQDLAQHAEVFEANAITFSDLGALTHDDLREGLGIRRFSERKKILQAIDRLRAEPEFALDPRAVEYPAGLSPGDMPTYIAHPWHALCAETHPRVKLHWLTDTAELAVRWAVSVTLAEILHAHDFRLPKKLAKQVRDHVERPTLGRWLGVLRELSANKPQETVLGGAPFALYKEAFEPRFTGGNRGGTLETSLLVLRNQIAHGGGMSRAHASELLAHHMPIISALLTEVLLATQGAEVIALEHGEAHMLRGTAPQSIPTPRDLDATTEGTWLLAKHCAMPLLPLAIYGPVRTINSSGQLQAKPGEPVAQVFVRAYHDRLSYTPLGRDEAHSDVLDVSIFREVFRLDEEVEERRSAVTIDGVSHEDALKEARAVSEELVGREQELGHVKRWLKSREPYDGESPKLGWISGGPGLGKSMLMARLAADYGSGAQRGFYFHKFGNAGNARSNRRMFLRFLTTALYTFAPLRAITDPPDEGLEGDALIDSIEARLGKLSELEPVNARAPRPQAWIFLDNVDEMIAQDVRFLELVKRLALPGTVWLMCGRPERGLDRAFNEDDRAEHIFAGGVPAMSAQDIRAMLLEGLGQARYALLRRDEDDDEGTHNVFIDHVVKKARGLPLYVKLLLDDLRSGALTVEDDDKLPDGLGAYYDGLMERIGLSTVSRDLPLIVSLLARAEEPLDVSALAALLSPHPDDEQCYRARVASALRVGRSLLTSQHTPEHTEGYLLYHQSFREYVGGRPSTPLSAGAPPAARLIDTVHEAERLLYRAAERWDTIPAGNLRNHLFRWGTTYTLELQEDAGLSEARARLTSYHYLHERLSALAGGAVVDIVAEYNELLRRTPPGEAQDQLILWEAFMRERAHLMTPEGGVCEHEWPAERALFQLAMEHADSSPVTRAAERWLARNDEARRWLWLRRPDRPAHLKEGFARKVFAGHGDRVEGALVLGEERVLSWSIDGTLKLWNMESGEEIATLSGHGASVDGALLVGAQRVVSWARNGTLCLWDLEACDLEVAFDGHTKSILGVHFFKADGEERLLSWSEDKTIRVWRVGDGTQVCCMQGHTRPIRGALVPSHTGLFAGHIISWSEDKTIRVWRVSDGEEMLVMKGHEREVVGATIDEARGELLSWGMDNTLMRFDLSTGEHLASFEGHTGTPMGARFVGEAEAATWALSWGKDHQIMRWTLDGDHVATWEGHKDWVDGVLVFEGSGRALSYGKDKRAIWWDMDAGKPIGELDGHAGWVRGAMRLAGGELLTWAGGGTMRVWEITRTIREDREREEVALLAVLEGHTAGVRGCKELPDGRLLSWSWDGSLRIWGWTRDERVEETTGHKGWIHAHKRWDESRAVTWSADATAIFWDMHTGEALGTLEGHKKSVDGVVPLTGRDRALTWSGDMTLATWDTSDYTRVTTMRGHTKKIQGAMETSAGLIASWSSDATIKLWDVSSGALLHDLTDHKKLVQGVREIAPGKLLSWSSDATIKLWDVSSGALLHDLTDHKKLIKDVRVFGDGQALSLSSDKTLRVWDVRSDEPACLHVLEGHTKLVLAAQIFGDERALSIGKDNLCIFWDLTQGAELWRIDELREPADGVTALDEERLLLWFKKGHAFVIVSALDGEELERVDMGEAMHTRPELWRARQEAGRFETLLGAWRAQSDSQGALLFRDNEGGVEEMVAWSATGSWSAMAMHERGVVTVHAGNYFYSIQLWRGAHRVGFGALT